ncbi:hypoxanthine phosphoribosyltransferase [Desulfovibrio sp. OttesenSCG-928-G15]|nr:hypoxanthine phosphoribosyltransferase [Desulfovibrio sp. OttesenSCG-928-G15]
MNITSLTEIFSSEEIAARVKSLAEKINKDYDGKDLVVLCVLKGAFMFCSDLVKELTVRPQIDFIRLTSYGNTADSSGNVVLTKDVELPIAGRHVLIVEDVVDTGFSMAFLQAELHKRGVKSLRLAALIDKLERRETDVTVDYAGFSLREGFIVGYGLDYAERFRELPSIYVASLE